jgi:cytoskeletal protein CcmA (bactofilin family)
MFGRKPPSGPAETPQPAAPTPLQPAAAARPATPPIPARPVAPATPAPAATTETDAKVANPQPVPAQPVRRPAEPVRAEPAAPAPDMRRLVVGRDITLAGELACDHRTVEGTVEARVKECQRLEIAETGLFRGTVEIRDADIGGRFEGEITVQGRLTVRSTGKIEGKIQYGELAVEAGGSIDGEIRGVGKNGSKVASKVGVKAPAEPLPFDPNPPAASDSAAAPRAEAAS